MTVLTDEKLMVRMSNGLIESGDTNRLTSNGYDLLLEDFKIMPGESKIVFSQEKVTMPKDLIALPFLRTTYAFKGLFLSPGVIDSGFHGKLRFSLFNPTKEVIATVKDKEKIAPIHLIFLETSGEPKLPFGMRPGEVNDPE